MNKTKNMCSGCKDNFYNGNNTYGIKECWNYKNARVVKRLRVGIWDKPPYSHKPIKVLSCYSEKGYAFLEV